MAQPLTEQQGRAGIPVAAMPVSNERKKRMIRDVFEELMRFLDDEKLEQTLYVYRIGPDGRAEQPYLLRSTPWPELLEQLRDVHGGGDFRIMIREGREMLFRGDVAIARRVNSPI